MNFDRNFRNLSLLAEREACDGVQLILGHLGEDVRLIREACKRTNPGLPAVVTVFTHDLPARRELCTAESLTAALPVVEAALKSEPESVDRLSRAMRWVELFEMVGAGIGQNMRKLAGLK